jgi:nicotinate-nucleotide adenylyltransferase
MRIGIFGGTFDPVHIGHLILAEQCREQGRLDEVWFVPSATPPHKVGQPITRFEQRVEMLALAVAGHPVFRINEIENETAGPNFTVLTLTELHRRHPDAEFHLLIGSDSLADLPKWREPARILELAALLVMPRPGATRVSVEELRTRLSLPEGAPLRLGWVEAPQIEVSSSDLRRRVAEGRSIRYFVPRAVECYIQEKKLYRES